jgi:hypothetical protein
MASKQRQAALPPGKQGSAYDLRRHDLYSDCCFDPCFSSQDPIDPTDEGRHVTTGAGLASGIGYGEGTPTPDRPGMELLGDAVISGNHLSAALLDADDG